MSRFCKIWGSCGCVAKDSRLLGCYTRPSVVSFMMFQRIILHLCAMSSCLLTLLTLEDNSHHDFSEMSGATHPITWCHITEELSHHVYSFCIQVFLSSHLNPQTSHLDRIFVIFQALPWKLQDGTQKYATSASFHIISDSFINHRVTWCYKGSLNKLRLSWFEWAQSSRMLWQMQK
jgi:hypothetical protein